MLKSKLMRHKDKTPEQIQKMIVDGAFEEQLFEIPPQVLNLLKKNRPNK